MLAQPPATESTTTSAPAARKRSPPTAATRSEGCKRRSAPTSNDACRSPEASPALMKMSAPIAPLRLVEGIDRRAGVAVARAPPACARASDDAALGGVHEEVHQFAAFGCREASAELRERGRTQILGTIELPVRLFEFVHGLARD